MSEAIENMKRNRLADYLYDHANSLYEHRGFCKTLYIDCEDKPYPIMVTTFKLIGDTALDAASYWINMIEWAGWIEAMKNMEGRAAPDMNKDWLRNHNLGIIWRRYPEVTRLDDGRHLITSRQIITSNPCVRGTEKNDVCPPN